MSNRSKTTTLKEFPSQATLLEMEMEVMKMIATDQPLITILDLVTQNFEKNIKGALCSILLMDKEGKHVVHGSAPSLPDEYCKAIDGLAIGQNRGSCGTAAYRKERVIVSDIANDPLWDDFKNLALNHGLRSCWSTPVLRNNGSVLGTFAIYYKEVKAPESIDLELIDRSANQVKIAIEQHIRALDLAESEEKYRSLAEGIADIITRYDSEIRITYANPSLFKLTGFKEEEIIGKTHHEIGFANEMVGFWDENIKSVFEIGKPLNTQFDWDGADGAHHFDLRLNPEFDQHGNVKSVLGVARDITNLKKAEQEIVKREKFLAVVIDNFPNSFLSVVGEDLRVLFNGGEAFVKSDQDPESYVGKSPADLFSELGDEIVNTVTEYYKKTLKGEPQVFELDLRQRHLFFKTVPLISDTKGINSLLVVAEDITEKKMSETALANSELLFTRLTANAPVGIFQTDLDGNCIYVNEEWIKHAGISYKEAMGDGWIRAIHPEDEGRVLIEWQNAVSDKKEFRTEMRFLTRQGKVTWLAARAVVLYDTDYQPYGYIGTAVDITDQKSIHSLLEENERRYRTTLERITDGFVSFDSNWRFTYLNNRAGEIFKCNPEEVVGQKVSTIFPSGTGRPFYLAYGKAMKYQRYIYLEEYYPPHDRWYENHVYPSLGGLSIYFRDISERKQDEMKLLQAMEILEVAEEQAKLGSWELEVSTDKRKWSKQLFRLLGFDPRSESVPHSEYIFRIHPEDRDKFDAGVEGMLNGEDPRPTLFRTNPEILPLKYLLNRWYAERDNNGNPLKFRGIIQDVTESIIFEQKIRESEEKYRTLVDQASDGIFIVNHSLQLQQVNRMACAMLGYSQEELLKLSLPDIVLFQENEVSFRMNEVREDVSLLQERTLKRKDGTTFPVEVNATRLKNGNTLSIVRDITERKNAEKALEESEYRLRTILDTEPECVKILNRRGELIDMNPAGLAMIQADSLQAVKGIELVNLVDGPYKEAFRKHTQDVFKGIIGKLEFEIIGLKGRKLWMETHAVPFRDSDGKIVSSLAVTRDITDRKNAEAKVNQYTNQLKELTVHLQHVREEERASLSRELHDELGQQLTAIKMDLSWLNKKVNSDELTSKIQETIHITLDAVSSLRRINSELRPSLLDDLGLFPALEYQASQFSKRFGVSCSIVADIDEPKFNQHYSIAIFRIFQESLNNIAKHAEATKVNVEIKEEEEKFHLIISDDGKGFNTNDKTKARSFGILGMTERAMMMNGTLTLKSKSGEGTTLELIIPIIAQ
ncbi:MAG: PAS domain S-box protein [Cyclobacteriaceae bacterium]|nr:PAS domain S-box protein [Cyclobacteriaceae bacterium]